MFTWPNRYLSAQSDTSYTVAAHTVTETAWGSPRSSCVGLLSGIF